VCFIGNRGFGWFFWLESIELFVCEKGLAKVRKNSFAFIKWNTLNKISISYSAIVSMGTISVTFFSDQNKTFRIDMNWRNRDPLHEVLASVFEQNAEITDFC